MREDRDAVGESTGLRGVAVAPSCGISSALIGSARDSAELEQQANGDETAHGYASCMSFLDSRDLPSMIDLVGTKRTGQARPLHDHPSAGMGPGFGPKH